MVVPTAPGGGKWGDVGRTPEKQTKKNTTGKATNPVVKVGGVAKAKIGGGAADVAAMDARAKERRAKSDRADRAAVVRNADAKAQAGLKPWQRRGFGNTKKFS